MAKKVMGADGIVFALAHTNVFESTAAGVRCVLCRAEAMIPALVDHQPDCLWEAADLWTRLHERWLKENP